MKIESFCIHERKSDKPNVKPRHKSNHSKIGGGPGGISTNNCHKTKYV